MSAQITELIDKQDTAEIVRDQIASILRVELSNQETLADDANKDPRLWKLRIFSERANAWEQYLGAPDQDTDDATPLVNVAFDRDAFDEKRSDIFERQATRATFHLDCYGYGQSADDGGSGHVAGDGKAALEAQRTMRLVRNVLMSAHYRYLGMRGTVWRRWPVSRQMFRPRLEDKPIQNIVGARLSLEVDFSEFSPQFTPTTLEYLSVTFKRESDGQVLLTTDYDFS